MKRLAWLGVWVGLLAACGSGGGADTTPASESPATTAIVTTTTVVDTPPTTATGAVDICGAGRAVLWEPGETYAADCFLVPVAFAPADPGWRTTGVADDRFLVTLVDRGEPAAEVALLGYLPSSGLDAVVDAILGLAGVTVASEPTEVRMGQWPAVAFEVETATDPRPMGAAWDECHSNTLGTQLATNGPGWRLLSGGLESSDEYGFAPCRTFRVWVVDVAGTAITMIATADEEQTLRAALPRIERLLGAMTFEPPVM